MTSRIAHGNISTRARIETTGELQILDNSFNQMTEDLSQTIKSRDDSVKTLVKEVVERGQMEEQLPQFRKMEALVTLAGRIAHDFNTLIGTIIGHSDIVSKKLSRESDLRDQLNTIIKVVNRAKTPVKQIGDFSRPKTIRDHRASIIIAFIQALAIIANEVKD